MAIPSLAMIPSGYKDGKVYSVLPSNGDGDFTFSRGSNATRVNKDGLIETVTGDTPRLDYSDSSCPSLLLEPQSTNLQVYSEDFGQSDWLEERVSVSTNQSISPDCTLNADELSDDANNQTHYLKSLIVTNNSTLSVFAKQNTLRYFNIGASSDSQKRVVFDLQEGVSSRVGSSVSNYGIEDYGNGWHRCWVELLASERASIFTSNSSTSVGEYVGDGSSIYIWGAQVEEQSYPTSYIPTSGTVTTRLADVCTDAGNEQVINSSEGVLYFEGSSLFDTPDSDRIIRIENSSDATNQYVDFRYDTTQNRVQIVVRENGVNQTTNGVVIADTTVNNKFALKYKVNDIALWVNGVEEITVSSASVPTGLDDLSFNNFYGNVKDVRIYATSLSDSELAILTTI